MDEEHDDESVDDDSIDSAADTQVGPTAAAEAITPDDWSLAWSQEFEGVDVAGSQVELPFWRRRGGTVLAAVGVCSLAVAVILGVITVVQMRRPEAPSADPPAPAEADGPTDPVDKRFTDDLRAHGIAVHDWRYMVKEAKAACATMLQPPAMPPGRYTLNLQTTAVLETHPNWTRSDAAGYLDAVTAAYCPQLRAPTPEQLAAMSPDDRYIALIQDQFGVAPDTGGSYQRSLDVAHQICSELSAGRPKTDIIDALTVSSLDPTRNWPVEDAHLLVDLTTQTFCPQFNRTTQ